MIPQVIFDHTLQQTPIVIPLTNPSPSEDVNRLYDNVIDRQQTSVYGILSPLISINYKVIDFIDVISFNLDLGSALPRVDMVVKDRNNLIADICTPTSDNEIRVQIIPPFDDAYKKINLTFYIASSRIGVNTVSLSGIYKVPALLSSNIKSFGDISTYTLYKSIAEQTGLGFTSNIDDCNDDHRWVYCDNKSYVDLMSEQIWWSGTSRKILDYWIDAWNSINLVDIYERYNAIDDGDDMKIWTIALPNQVNCDNHATPFQMRAEINNHPFTSNNQMHVRSYTHINKTASNVWGGTDTVADIYEMNNDQYRDHMIQNGNIKHDIFQKYIYSGENYGETNYLLNKRCREMYMKSMTNDIIEVKLNQPVLGLIRGRHVDFVWYEIDPIRDAKLQALGESGAITKQEDMQSTLDMRQSHDDGTAVSSSQGDLIINKTVSGQYMILSVKISYENSKWTQTMQLVRPDTQKPKYIEVGSDVSSS